MIRYFLYFYLLIVALPSSSRAAIATDEITKETLFSENKLFHAGRSREIKNLDIFKIKTIKCHLHMDDRCVYLIYSTNKINKKTYFDCWSYHTMPLGIWQVPITNRTLLGKVDKTRTVKISDYFLTFENEEEYRRFLEIFVTEEVHNRARFSVE